MVWPHPYYRGPGQTPRCWCLQNIFRVGDELVLADDERWHDIDQVERRLASLDKFLRREQRANF